MVIYFKTTCFLNCKNEDTFLWTFQPQIRFRLDYQPLSGKWARAQPRSLGSGGWPVVSTREETPDPRERRKSGLVPPQLRKNILLRSEKN